MGAVVAVIATTVAVGASVAQSPIPSPAPTELDPDAIVLTGRITGRNEGPYGIHPGTDYATLVTMDLTLTLTPDRMIAEGVAMVSGSYSGECQFAHEEAVPIAYDSNPDGPVPVPTPSTGRPGFASVQVYTTDPRYDERPLTGFYLSLGAGTSGQGGDCGYLTGRVFPVTDIGGPLRIDVMGCQFLDVINVGDAYTGSCAERDASSGMVSIEWTASFQESLP